MSGPLLRERRASKDPCFIVDLLVLDPFDPCLLVDILRDYALEFEVRVESVWMCLGEKLEREERERICPKTFFFFFIAK